MSNKRIAIVGAGIGGLTLAYALAKANQFDLTLIAAKSADEVRGGRIPSTQVHFHRLLEKEKLYDMPDYGEANPIKRIELLIGGQRLFAGNLQNRAVSIDQRVYLPALIEGLSRKKIPFVQRRVMSEDLPSLADQFDLIIDCSGKIGPVAPFPLSDDVSNMPSSPLRICSAGIFDGIDTDDEYKMSYNIVPGMGELFDITTMTSRGPARQLLLETVPGSELDGIKGDMGPADFAARMKEVLARFFPHVHERLTNQFGLVDDKAYLRMAIKPQVRIPYATIGSTLLLGCGDSVALNDPITGQGANAASYCAGVLYDALMEHREGSWDQALGELYWQRIKRYVVATTEWSNAMMGPPSPSFGQALDLASASQEAADNLVNLFADPEQAHALFFA